MIEYNNIYLKKNLCANCGKIGHEFRHCVDPITSFGIINVKILDDINESLLFKDKFRIKKENQYKLTSKKYPFVKCYVSNNIKLYNDDQEVYKLDNDSVPYSDEDHIHKFKYYKNKVLFLMVSRRFSLGFIEFIRGKYDVFNVGSIINLFEQMYDEEIRYIQHNDYDDILYYFLNRNSESKEIVLNRIYEGKYSNEYCEAKMKFTMLANPVENDNTVPWSLSFYTKYIRPRWDKPEWGFPKGRRDKRHEDNLTCACREFEEETGYKKGDYSVLNKIEPIEENLIGTNGIHYKHIYYLSLNNCEKDHLFTDFDSYEIGDIKWFTYDEAINYIRDYHVEKKKILTRVYLFMLNYLMHNSHEFGL